MVTTEYVVPGSCSSFGMGPGGRLGAVNRSLDSTEKVLHVVNFDLLEKMPHAASGTMGWILLTALKANMEKSALHDAAQVCKLQRQAEQLE